jgi:hypothetical protein
MEPSMPDASTPALSRNPPVDYAVAVWLGTPEHEIAKGLREGWIRRPGAALRALDDGGTLAHAPSGAPQPPAPDEGESPLPHEAVVPDVRSRLAAVMRRLDRSMTDETFERVWTAAGADEAGRTKQLVEFLGATLGVAAAPGNEPSPALDELEAAASLASGAARFVELASFRASELESLARDSGLVRRALAEHSPWAFAEDPALVRIADPLGRFDRYDPDTGEALLSDAWIGDRAKHAAWRAAAASGRSLEIDTESWRFIDRAAHDGATIELAGAPGAAVHQVIFAQDGGDRVTGADGTDRLHGGGGDDTLRGRAGADLLEGAAGNDLLQGGSGDDGLAGQQGDDELEGGAGNDTLQGGSGDDELTGGAGNDTLEGGGGTDVYRLESGAGDDLVDDDGGTIFIDDVAVEGTMRPDGESWVSADGRLRFSLEGGATLVIRTQTDAPAAPNSVVRVRHWQQGAFGITLGEVDDPGVEAPADASPPEALPSVPESGQGEVDDATSATGPLGSADSAFANAFEGLEGPTFDLSTLVDPGHVEALETTWTAQGASPALPSDVSGVTLADLALALSDGSADDGEAFASSTFESAFLRPLVPPQPFAAPEPFLPRTA